MTPGGQKKAHGWQGGPTDTVGMRLSVGLPCHPWVLIRNLFRGVQKLLICVSNFAGIRIAVVDEQAVVHGKSVFAW